ARRAARSVWTNAILSIPAWAIFFGLGTALWAFYKTHPTELDPSAMNDEIFPSFIIHELPPGCAGLLVVALLAAAMSSLQSGINAMSSVIVNDFYRRAQREPDDAKCLRVGKVMTLLLGCTCIGFASYIAVLQSPSIWNQFLKLMGLFGGGMGGLFLAGIFTRRTNSAGILVGFVASTIVLYFVQKSDAIHLFLYGGIGMFSCFAVGWLASWVLPSDGRDLTGLTIFTKRQTNPPAQPSRLPFTEAEASI
ncbi:MAG TPA: sodium:solute symporter, partial [Pirellulales bacterium]